MGCSSFEFLAPICFFPQNKFAGSAPILLGFSIERPEKPQKGSPEAAGRPRSPQIPPPRGIPRKTGATSSYCHGRDFRNIFLSSGHLPESSFAKANMVKANMPPSHGDRSLPRPPAGGIMWIRRAMPRELVLVVCVPVGALCTWYAGEGEHAALQQASPRRPTFRGRVTGVALHGQLAK